MEVGAALEGNIVDVAPETEMDLAPVPVEELPVPKSQPTLDGLDFQLRLTAGGATTSLHDSFGCACGSSGAPVCGARGVMAWGRGRRRGARGR
jgi:hypothetical protein